MSQKAKINSIALTLLLLFLENGCAMQAGEGIVEEMRPSPGSSDVDREASIKLKTNQPLKAARVKEEGAVTLLTAEGRRVHGSVSLNPSNTEITFTPKNPLATGQTFRLCLLPHVRTSGGTPLSVYRVDPDLDIFTPLAPSPCFRFSTKKDLKVRESFTLVEDEALHIYFSRDLDTQSINDAEILWSQDRNSGAVEMRYSPTKKRLTLYPRGSVDFTLPITVHLPPTIKTPDGISLTPDDDTVLVVSPTESDR